MIVSRAFFGALGGWHSITIEGVDKCVTRIGHPRDRNITSEITFSGRGCVRAYEIARSQLGGVDVTVSYGPLFPPEDATRAGTCDGCGRSEEMPEGTDAIQCEYCGGPIYPDDDTNET